MYHVYIIYVHLCGRPKMSSVSLSLCPIMNLDLLLKQDVI